MLLHKRSPGLLLVVGLVLGAPCIASAERVRLHYAATSACVASQPTGPAERVSLFGAARGPYNCPLRPNHVVTFRHAFTGQLVSVPIAFPEGTPRIEYRADRIFYNYGSYIVEAIFLRDGTVDVVYDSGFLRPLQATAR